MTSESLMEFPCDFPIKVMGHHTEEFHAIVIEIVSRHTGNQSAPGIRPSSNNRFVALSFTVNATSREQLDALYQELSDHELVLFAL